MNIGATILMGKPVDFGMCRGQLQGNLYQLTLGFSTPGNSVKLAVLFIIGINFLNGCEILMT